MRTRRLVPFLVLGLVIATSSSALCAKRSDPQARQLGALMADIRTWLTVDGLDLSREQMQALLPIARQVRAEHDAILAERARTMGDYEQGIRGLREELLANNGVSDAAKAGVIRAEAGWKKMGYAADERVPERVRAVLDILTPEQVEFVMGKRPALRMARAGAEAATRVEKLLLWARQASPQQFERALQPAPRLRAGAGVQNRRQVPPQIAQILVQARTLSEPDFQAHKSELVQALLAAAPRQAGQQQAGRAQNAGRARAANQQTPDLQNRIARTLLVPPVATVLEARLAIAQPGPVRAMPEFPEPIAGLVTDVRDLNLVNSLYLTPQQMQALNTIISRADAERDANLPRTEDLASRMIAAGNELRSGLASGQVTPDTHVRIRDGFTQAGALERERLPRLAQYVGEVKGVLSENQMMLVSEFIPCIVPVRSLTNPERIGQAQNTEGAERLLGLARKAPEQRLATITGRAQERLQAAMLHKHFPGTEIQARLADVPRAIAEARAMSDSQFEVEKVELAKRISPPDRPAVVGPALDARIAEYLLSPNLLPIFSQRVAAQPGA